MILSLLHLKEANSYSQITALGGSQTSEKANNKKRKDVLTGGLSVKDYSQYFLQRNGNISLGYKATQSDPKRIRRYKESV